jgi:RimJ/RimL family protein N-acetyltransferase
MTEALGGARMAPSNSADTPVDALQMTRLFETDRGVLAAIFAHPGLLRSLHPLEPRALSVAEAVAFWFTPLADEDGLIGAARSPDGVMCGCIRIDAGRVAYFIEPGCWRRGYGRRMMQWAMAGLVRGPYGAPCEAMVRRENLASVRLLETSGFVFSGLHRGGVAMTTLLRFKRRS